jgi:N-acetylglucosaminyl-diphospho-decaprenol L-rhamnosyltransferase
VRPSAGIAVTTGGTWDIVELVTASPDLVVSIVNYRCAPLTLRALQTLEPEVRQSADVRVWVVENDSGDAEALARGIEERGFESWVELDVAPRNGGFAYGNNRVLRRYLQAGDRPRPRYFWLLNPDTEVLPGALSAARDFLDAHPNAGIAGSRMVTSSGEDFRVRYFFPSLVREFEGGIGLGPVTRLMDRFRPSRTLGDGPERVDWLPGAAMMVRREVFETIGLMDESYFLYFEETDLCLSAARAGFETWHVPDSRVVHVAGGSTGWATGRGDRVPKHWFDSRKHYYRKNHGTAYAMAADAVQLTSLGLRITRHRVEDFVGRDKEREPAPKQLFRDCLENSLLFSNLRR